MIEFIRPILNLPFFYEGYHHLIGADYRSRVLVDEYIEPKPGDRILDIGCGPGNMLPFLPECRYVGFDANPTYIESAKKRYSDRGEFHSGRVSHHNIQEFSTFDIVLALGLLHHLDDNEGCDLFRLAKGALKPGGRMITNDGCYVDSQSAVKRYLLSRDRGRYVRTAPQYEALAGTQFQMIASYIREDVLKIPYTHLVMVCTREWS